MKYIKVDDFLKYCSESAELSRRMYHECLDKAINGNVTNLSAAAFFDNEYMMFGYKIPNIIKNLNVHEFGSDVDNTPIESVDFSLRTFNVLKRSGIETLEQLTEMFEYEVYKIRNLGRKSLLEIKSILKERGLKLKGE